MNCSEREQLQTVQTYVCIMKLNYSHATENSNVKVPLSWHIVNYCSEKGSDHF